MPTDTEVDNHTAALQNIPGYDFDATKQTTIFAEDLKRLKARLDAVLEVVYPIGSVYTSTDAGINPADILGFGQWGLLDESSETGWIELNVNTGFAHLSGSGGLEAAKARVVNGIVYLQGGFTNAGISAGGSYTVATLPTGINPPSDNVIFRFGTSSGNPAATGVVNTAGNIILRANSTLSSYYKFGGQAYVDDNVSSGISAWRWERTA